MKKAHYILISFVLLTTLLSSCATITKPEVSVIKEKSKISKTIQQEKTSIGAKKGLKRKVAIARFTNETKYGQSHLSPAKIIQYLKGKSSYRLQREFRELQKRIGDVIYGHEAILV